MTIELEGKPMQEKYLQFPLRSLSKTEIFNFVGSWLNDNLEFHTPDETYVFLKQLEFAVKDALMLLKPAAVTAYQVERREDVLGHKVEIMLQSKWTYSRELTQFQEVQKKELKARQLQEQVNGTATIEKQEPMIKITLRR